jgi:integrase
MKGVYMARGRKKENDKKRRWNGSGCIRKLSGNRKNPFVALLTTGYEFNEITLKRKQIQKPLGYYPTWDAADNALEKYFDNPYDVINDNLTFTDVYNEWSKRYFKTLNNHSSERTVISAYNHSKPMHDMIFKSITITIMKDTINNSNIGPATKGRMKSLYNLMFDFACESRIVEVNTARNFTMKGLLKEIDKRRVSKKPFSEHDEDILWKNIDYGFTKMILIGLYTGWRPQELVLLDRNNIDIKNWTMIGGMKTEAGTNRIIPVHKKIRDLVSYYYSQSDGYERLFNDFDGQQGTFMTYDKYRGRFNKVMNRCRLSGYTPHCTRHTFITKAKESKVDEYAIKMIVGHESDDVTEKVYTHRDDLKFMIEEIDKIK